MRTKVIACIAVVAILAFLIAKKYFRYIRRKQRKRRTKAKQTQQTQIYYRYAPCKKQKGINEETLLEIGKIIDAARAKAKVI